MKNKQLKDGITQAFCQAELGLYDINGLIRFLDQNETYTKAELMDRAIAIRERFFGPEMLFDYDGAIAHSDIAFLHQNRFAQGCIIQHQSRVSATEPAKAKGE